jgi:hypothetical protein
LFFIVEKTPAHHHLARGGSNFQSFAAASRIPVAIMLSPHNIQSFGRTRANPAPTEDHPGRARTVWSVAEIARQQDFSDLHGTETQHAGFG